MLLVFISCCLLNNFFTMSVGIENARLKLGLAIPTGAPITVANNAEQLPNQIKQLKIHQNN